MSGGCVFALSSIPAGGDHWPRLSIRHLTQAAASQCWLVSEPKNLACKVSTGQRTCWAINPNIQPHKGLFHYMEEEIKGALDPVSHHVSNSHLHRPIFAAPSPVSPPSCIKTVALSVACTLFAPAQYGTQPVYSFFASITVMTHRPSSSLILPTQRITR